jgi:hypothetical protein
MRTDHLIAMLATGSGPADTGAARRRYALSLGGGGIVAMLILAFGMGINPELAQALRAPMYWAKLAYCAALAVSALALAARLARPGARAAVAAAVLATPLLAMWVLALIALQGASAAERDALVFGDTWRDCPFNIALLSLPLFGALLWALKGLAPTRPVRAGAAAGWLAGTAAALVYSLHCPELGAPFLGIWYPLGMLIPTIAGGLVGSRLLRW